MVTRSDGSDHVENSEVIKDAEIGAAAGAIGGTLLSLAAVVVPGIGPVIAVGPLLGVLGGASIGAVTGGLIGALTKIGVPHDTAHLYAESVRRGDAIVTVRTDDAGAERALRVMNEYGALDIEARADGWRDRGWAGPDHRPAAGRTGP